VFTYLVKDINDETYMEAVSQVKKFFNGKGRKLTTVRTDFRNIYRTEEVTNFNLDNDIDHQSSSPYHKWQSTVERDIQTMMINVAAIIYGSMLMRADSWSHAIEHYVRIHNDVPNLNTRTTPNRLIDSTAYVNALYQYRYAFGDMICYGIPKELRGWKFDVRNELGLYLGDVQGVKGSCKVYQPYEHSVIIRADTAPINVSEAQLLHWYHRRMEVHQRTLPYKEVEDAVIDLMHINDAVDHKGTQTPSTEENTQRATDTLTTTMEFSDTEGDKTVKARRKRGRISRKRPAPIHSDRKLRPKHAPTFAPRYINSVTSTGIRCYPPRG